jgi:hypothetical protein
MMNPTISMDMPVGTWTKLTATPKQHRNMDVLLIG